MTDVRKEITRVFGIKQPVSIHPFIKGDEWHHPDEGLRIFNGTAWVLQEAKKEDAKLDDDKDDVDDNQAAAEKAQLGILDADAQRQKNEELQKTLDAAHESTKKGGAPTPSHKKGGK